MNQLPHTRKKGYKKGVALPSLPNTEMNTSKKLFYFHIQRQTYPYNDSSCS
jgi:hypothetical protein